MTIVAPAPLVNILILTALTTEGGSFSIFPAKVPGLALIGPAWSLNQRNQQSGWPCLGLVPTPQSRCSSVQNTWVKNGGAEGSQGKFRVCHQMISGSEPLKIPIIFESSDFETFGVREVYHY